MRNVKDILNSKGREVWSVGPNDSVLDVLRLMAEKEVGATIVLDGERIAGIVSERDYARKVALKGRTSREARAADIMTSTVVCVRPEQSIEECMELMTRGRLRHLPVVDRGKLVGVVSIGDLVKAIIDEQEFTINQLQSYITG
ncbi:MAG TPA: CBS domain-containing protein [Gammaproteobacteria bacterium]|nr:CBS domain-containing protein [Gammaproteobacteria bacterium]